jgi:hypothetical protein
MEGHQMLTKEGASRTFAPSGAGVAATETRETMNGFQDGPDIAAVTSRLERVEQYVRASAQPLRTWREPTLQPPDYRDGQYDTPGPALLRARRSTGISPWLFVMATALNTMVAALLAVVITLGVVEGQSRDNQTAAIPAASTAGPGGYTRVSTGYTAEAPRPAGTQPLTLRPIGSSNQPLRLEAGKPTRLPLLIQPESAAAEPYIMVLGGAPAGTTLSGGASRMGSDSWFLPPGSASRLEITLPEWSNAPFELAIELRRTNGLVAGQATAWLAVPPPGGAAETTGMGTDQAAARELLAQGSRLIERGEIVAARSVFQRAADMGSGEAALALGATYDPNRLWALGAMGMVGNKERAKHWYARANDLGHPEAGARLRLLSN